MRPGEHLSPEKDVEVQFPFYSEIVADATVSADANTEWANTLADCTQTPNQRREKAYWIRLVHEGGYLREDGHDQRGIQRARPGGGCLAGRSAGGRPGDTGSVCGWRHVFSGVVPHAHADGVQGSGDAGWLGATDRTVGH